ncbi:MAG: tetratricopeptide repeat protein [Candidatus Poribacteria bacterium]|nr:tetratricopeptide repeat protein [Candidatus Poribacteria bacterium]
MSDETKSRSPLRNWLPLLEGAIIVLFIALIVVFIHNGATQSNASSVTQAHEFIKKGDQDFAERDLGRAALAYWEAIRIIESAKREDKQRVDALGHELFHANLRVAEIYLHSSWIKDARSRLEHAARIKPDHVKVHLLRGKLERDIGERPSAANEFLAVIEKDPNHAEAHYLLGLLYRSNEQFENAVAHYKAAIKNDSELVELPFESQPIGLQARLQLARTYWKMLQDYRLIDREISEQEINMIGQMEEAAVAVLEEAVDRSPNFAEARTELIRQLVSRALIIERQGDTRPYDEALKVYERVVELDPTDADIWKKMGEIHAHFMHDKEAALKTFKEAYRIEPAPAILAEIENLEADLANEADQQEQ